MTTVGLELTSFIDPSLTWKKVSKGRSSSRRSRNMKLVQEQEKRSSKRLHSLQSSEDSEKSNVMTHGRRFAGNMEHIPIKKRKLFFRSPSPPLQSPNGQGESEGLVGGQCTSDHSIEPPAMQIDVSNGSRSKDLNSDGNIDKSSVKSSNEVHGIGDDFSGIAILAAAACSDRLDNTNDDAAKIQSQMSGLSDIQCEPFGAASGVKESITKTQSLDLLGNDTKGVDGVCVASGVKESITKTQSLDLLGNDTKCVDRVCVVNLSKDDAQLNVNNEADDVGMSSVEESQKVEQNKSVAFTSVHKESIECVSSPDLLRNDVVEESIPDLPNEYADKTPGNSGTSRDCRLHWDLNTVMDEWDDPVEDSGVVSSAQALEVAPMDKVDSQNLEDVDGSKANESEIQNLENVEGLEARRAETTEGFDNLTFQVEVCGEPEHIGSGTGFTNVSPTISRAEHCSVVSSGFVTSILKENPSPNANDHVVEATMLVTDQKIHLMGVNEDANIDHSLSLGLNGIKILASEEISNRAASENANQLAEETSCLQSVQSEEHGIGSWLAPLSENASAEVKAADFKVKVDENDNVVNVTCQPTAPNSLGNTKLEVADLSTSESGEVSCKVNDLNCKFPQQLEKVVSLVDSDDKHGKNIAHSVECQPSCSENQLAELKDCVSLHSSKLDSLTTSINANTNQAMDRVIAKEIEEKPTVTCAYESDPVNHNGSEEPAPKILEHCVAVDASSEPIKKSLGSDHGSHVSNEDASKVTENAVNVTEIGDYDSHLEDGELREPLCWEDNEGEEVETEHVDYDSDNRDGIVFYEAANDCVQLSGEVLVGECEKQNYRSDNFSSDDRPNPDNEESCSLRIQGCLSTMNSMEAAVCTKPESPALKACSGTVNSDKVEIDHKECRSSIEADSVRKDSENDPPRNAGGASASGRDLQFLDQRCMDSMRRSRSSNFDGMHNSDTQDESRSQQSSVRLGRFGGRSWNTEQKSIVGNTAAEDDSERIIGSTGDNTSPLRGRRSRIINTSRSGYHFVRRGGSPGERDGNYGVGMMKVRDFSPDNNPRNRFGRFNGASRGGFREGYRRPNVYDPPKSGGSGPMMNRFGKRERSFSPVGDRFHRKSRSRSRTRSPDFRSDARMGRPRVPYQQSNHAAEHPRERRSPPPRVFNQSQRFDTMGSPGRLRSDDCIRPPMRPMRFHDTTTSGRVHDFDEGDEFRRKPILMRNHRRSRSRSRSCSPDFRSDTRMGPMRVPYQPSADHIRERRSPVRVFRPDQRYEAGGSPVRIRSDECSRPMMRPVRFPDSAQSGRGHDFNNNNNHVNGDEYRRKPRTIFERIHPIRHYNDMEGDVRRFPFDEEGASTQNFQRNENYARGPGERRPIEFRGGGPREERGHVRYNNNNSDRMFYSGPKQQFNGGIRDYGGEEGIPRRVRP